MSDLRQKKIAVIGVSGSEKKFGHRIFIDLLSRVDTIAGVHPLNGSIAGRILYRSLPEVPFIPDLVITVVPPEVTLDVVKQCITLGVPEVWMQPGSESEAAIAVARKAGIKVTHSACFMIQHQIW